MAMADLTTSNDEAHKSANPANPIILKVRISISPIKTMTLI
jgi:hypothetical protein